MFITSYYLEVGEGVSHDVDKFDTILDAREYIADILCYCCNVSMEYEDFDNTDVFEEKISLFYERNPANKFSCTIKEIV